MVKLNAEKKYAANRKIDIRKIDIGIVRCSSAVMVSLETLEKRQSNWSRQKRIFYKSCN
jgi:hypothetical protein